ncbi:MAG: hypothetical protein ABW208_14815 [Pyrinomonadaceae bacterium]
MSERPENFNPAGEDPEATLVAPRFDAADARRAHPVVPLAGTTAPTPYVSAHAPRRRVRRRSWMPALLSIALLAVAAAGGALAMKYMQGPRAERVQDAERIQEQPQQEQPQAAPVQTAEAPTQQPVTSPAAEAPRADAPAAKPATRDPRPRRARAVVADSALEDAEDYEDRRGRGRGRERRRGRDDDEVEKEMRKAMKRAQKNAPRLVDVLTRP